MTLEAVGCEAAVGGRCLVDTAEGKQIEAEVVGFSGDKLFLDAYGRYPRHHAGRARHPDAQRARRFAVGDELLGRVLDGAGGPSTASGSCAAPIGCR